jgi:hypothetical protein
MQGSPNNPVLLRKIAIEMGTSEEDLQAFNEYRRQRADPKIQANPQLSERATLRVHIANDTVLGERELRLLTGAGLTNPISFHIGQLTEYSETEPNNKAPDRGFNGPVPVVFNGQILPGDVDRFQFEAVEGTGLVVATSARTLIPHLADAVPGWFQATLALYDPNGNEVAYVDDYRFNPDPILYYEIRESGPYVLEIKDAIYRGREDFVYRLTVGEMPFVTSVFPLGGPAGERTTIELEGWNLPVDKLTLVTTGKKQGTHPIFVRKDGQVTNFVPFSLSDLPDRSETEPNNDCDTAHEIKVPVIVNGRGEDSGDWDVFRFEGRAGDEIVAEVKARRLESPLDSVLVLTDSNGLQIAVNDDFEDKGLGLLTHHADSRLGVTLPSDGVYYLRLGDTQNNGGRAFGYRLRISPLQPDFELRVVPSSINARAGATVPITVYALRRDGFSGDISLRLVDPPRGFILSGAWVPAGRDSIQLTLTVPPAQFPAPLSLNMEGIAEIAGKKIRRPAIPAEDMMQAFIYRHLVPADKLFFSTNKRGRSSSVRLLEKKPVKLAVGGTTKVRMSAPKRWPAKQVQLEIDEPPEGITVKNISTGQGSVAIQLESDSNAIEPGLKGNLIVQVFVERPIGGEGPRRKEIRRVPLGTLPAIPFEIVRK